MRQVWGEGNHLRVLRKDLLSSLSWTEFPSPRYDIDTKHDNASCMDKTGIRLKDVIRNFSDNSEEIFFLRNLPKSVGKIILHLCYPGPFSILTVKSICPRRFLP